MTIKISISSCRIPGKGGVGGGELNPGSALSRSRIAADRRGDGKSENEMCPRRKNYKEKGGSLLRGTKTGKCRGICQWPHAVGTNRM